MQRTTKYLIIYSLAVTVVAGLMTYNTVKLVDVEYNREDAIATTTAQTCPTLAEQLSTRAYELREENKNMDLERYRQDAILEVNLELQAKLGESPFINYEELKEKYAENKTN